MQPLLMLAIAGVAAVALGTGFLNNDIELWIQDFGVGAGNIELPADHAIIDFNIVKVADGDFFKNVINKCFVTLNADVGDPDSDSKDSSITCKITGKSLVQGKWVPNGKVIAEGILCGDSFDANTPYEVPLGVQTGCTTLPIPQVDGPEEVDPKMAGDVILVVHADTYNDGMALPP